jgi:membrane protease YdiL (CAAX protease family)
MDQSLFLFLVITASISTPLFLSITPGKPLGTTLILFLLGSLAPILAACVTLRFVADSQERQAFWRRLCSWRAESIWYAMALLAPTVIWMIAFAHFLPGMGFKTAQPAGLLFLPLVLIACYCGEAGWRGFILPRLLTRMDPIPASLLLGFFWGLFYVPLFWREPLTLGLILALGLALSIPASWIFLGTGESVSLTALFLASFITWEVVSLTVSNLVLVLAIALAGVWTLFLFMRYGESLLNLPPAEENPDPESVNEARTTWQTAEQPGNLVIE